MLQPLHHNVLIKPDADALVSPGGIHLSKPEDLSYGTVVAVGPGKHMDNGVLIAQTLKPGDRVIYHRPYGTDCVIDSVKHKLLSGDSVLARVV